jgi:hypothetical protein
MKIRIQTGFSDIRDNNEDIILTPSLGGLYAKNEVLEAIIIGVSINWIYYSIYIAIGFNVPKELPHFLNHHKRNKK